MKQVYEKPVISKLQVGLMNKYGTRSFYSKNVRTEIEGVSIDELVEKHGSPLFVFSEIKLRQKVRNLKDSFSTRYPNVTIGWSYKTNYLQAICAVMHQEGSIAEVVSEMEYQKARKMGIEGKDIIFNGPHKKPDALETAILEGSMINVDNLDEVMKIEKIAHKLNKKVKIGIRLNMDVGIYPLWSRFGFNLENEEALNAVKRIAGGGKLVLNGLHCHIGTFILDSEAYAKQVEKMVKFGYQIEEEFGFKIEYLDIGGGFPSKSRLKGIYMPPDIVVPSIDEYAEKITGALFKHLKPGDFPELILESGRALVDEAGYLISTVFASKRLPDGRKAYIMDAGVNLLYTSTWYKFNIEIDRETPYVNESSILYGPLCMNIDIIEEGTLLPPLSKGTRLIISPVGAYNITQWMQFIEYRPAIVMVGTKGQVDVIREAEDLTDIERREILPERLKLK